MQRFSRFILVILMLTLLFSSLSGCGLFREQKPEPRTPSEWIAKPRP